MTVTRLVEGLHCHQRWTSQAGFYVMGNHPERPINCCLRCDGVERPGQLTRSASTLNATHRTRCPSVFNDSDNRLIMVSLHIQVLRTSQSSFNRQTRCRILLALPRTAQSPPWRRLFHSGVNIGAPHRFLLRHTQSRSMTVLQSCWPCSSNSYRRDIHQGGPPGMAGL